MVERVCSGSSNGSGLDLVCATAHHAQPVGLQPFELQPPAKCVHNSQRRNPRLIGRLIATAVAFSPVCHV